MSEPGRLHGVTFDHPRSIDPLRAASDLYASRHGLYVDWTTHDLGEFERGSLAGLASRFDVIMFDHPFIGEALTGDVIYPLDQLLSVDELQTMEDATLGLSYQSYFANGHLWAAPVDGAAQFAAWRHDLLSDPPSTWSDLLRFGRDTPGVLVPLTAAHAACTFFTVGWNLPSGNNNRFYLDDVAVTDTISKMRALVAVVDPLSFDLNPIDALDLMAEGADHPYSPFVFGYTPYAADGFRQHSLCFGTTPTVSATPNRAVMGGAGIGISKHTQFPSEAARYAAWLTSNEVQAVVFPRHLGQPASRAGWGSIEREDLYANFFDGTSASLASAFVRPRMPGFPEFQHEMGELVRDELMTKRWDQGLPAAIRALFYELCSPGAQELECFDFPASVDSRFEPHARAKRPST